MEALELHHAEQWSVPTERLTYHEAFRHLDAPPPDRLPLTAHGPFLPDWPYAWVRGWDLNGQREVAVPAAMVRMGDRRGRLENLFSFQVTSNGLASGANLVEAIHSGLLEVIERDAVTCWQHRWTARGEPPPTVSTAAHTSEVITDLLGRLAANGARVLLFDCTIDTQVPVYMAFLFDEDDSFRGIYKGFGAHLDPDRAIVRAITEACQARAVHIAGSRDDLFRHRLTATGVEEQFRSMVEMHRRTEESRAGELPLSVHFDTFEDDVAYLVDRLADVGLDRVVVVDLSKPYLPVAVVKVVVPGMEGFMVEDYTPGFRALRFAGGD
jgi:ribosomal protein S12 methylthiotransferase accessory factor